MTITIFELAPDAIEVIAEGKMLKSDYDMLVPAIEDRIERHGKINLILNLSHFKGWSLAAIWEELKFDFKHYHHVNRLALVAENPDREWMARISRPFTAAEVEFFPLDAHETARQWVTGPDQ